MPNSTIKILSWNIEHFKMGKAEKVAEVIRSHDPDVFSLYEVEAAPIYEFMLQHFPGHSIFITQGQQTQEILVACRNQYEGIKFQQKDQFRSGNPYLRPGAFLTFRFPGASMYGFLFLHTDSGTTAVDFGNRNEMFEHGMNLKRKLDHINDALSNFMILGDLNTMGLKYPRPRIGDQIADTQSEIAFIDYEAGRKGKYNRKPEMRRLSKPAGTHFSETYGVSDLDHVLSGNHLRFKPQTNYGEAAQFEVHLDGWRKFMGNAPQMKKFAEEVSDHCLLLCELIVE